MFLCRKKEKYNAVIAVHGGGWHAGITKNKPWNGDYMRKQAEYYADKGFVGI